MSRLQRGVGSRWKAEATEDKAKLAKAAANGGRAEASEEKAEEVHRLVADGLRWAITVNTSIPTHIHVLSRFPPLLLLPS